MPWIIHFARRDDEYVVAVEELEGRPEDYGAPGFRLVSLTEIPALPHGFPYERRMVCTD